MTYIIDRSSACRSFIADVRNAVESTRRKLNHICIAASYDHSPLLFNNDYDAALTMVSCYEKIYQLCLGRLCSNPMDGPTVAEVDEFVHALKYQMIVIDASRDFKDVRMLIWNRTISEIMDWISYRALVRPSEFTEELIKRELLPYHIAYEI